MDFINEFLKNSKENGKINSSTLEIYRKDIEDMLRFYSIRYVYKCDLSNQEILDEYMNCDIVSFPSLYEGFGMPIIEGQAVGRVVFTSDLEPMKEIAGDAALLVDPYSIESIRNGA